MTILLIFAATACPATLLLLVTMAAFALGDASARRDAE